MTVKELIGVLQTFDQDAHVCFNDRGIYRDAREPISALGMYGPCVLLDYGTFDSKGYVVNYSKRYGYEMVLNDCIRSRLDNLPPCVYDELQRSLLGIGFEINDECIELGKNFPPSLETIGADCPRNFPDEVWSAAEKAFDKVKETLA